TTVVAYTIGLLTGSILTFRSAMNRQKTYGADVISRIQYSQEYEGGLHKMHKAIVSQLQELFDDMLKQLSLKRESVVDIAIAGNTTMLHLFADIDPSGIAAAPFIPVFTRSLTSRASDFGFKFPGTTSLQLLPSVASYIGADITAGMLTTKLLDNGKNKMLLDIGTNGEIALSKDGHIFCCSSAAGPAFEGANITFGVGGIFGAVDSVKVAKKKQSSAKGDESQDSFYLEYTSIGDKPAVGICGSAIIDITAVLLDLGLVDFTGRIDDSKEEYAHLLTTYQDQPAVILVPASETADGKSILFTQKDIREVQLAKSAIAAGIQTLLHESGTDSSQISTLYIAGGFGNYIHVPSAVRIGLIPSELENKTKAAGNTAGRGAVQFLIDKYAAEECRDILEKTRYIELSSNTAFQNFYIEQMVFPE
ncbi:MAG: ASKHA domain-containing protein, partial [Spirochaetia bacterium]|nr:ASKHA domain-containing protein [Spirochaetia bacterium]